MAGQSWKQPPTPAPFMANLRTMTKPMKSNKMEDLKEKNHLVIDVGDDYSGEATERVALTHVVRMLAVMESNPESTDPVMEFLVTGRTGRRNAMADILGPHATITSGDLPERMQSLSTVDKDAGPSSTSQGTGPEPQDSSMDCHSSPPPSSQEGTAKPKSEATTS